MGDPGMKSFQMGVRGLICVSLRVLDVNIFWEPLCYKATEKCLKVAVWWDAKLKTEAFKKTKWIQAIRRAASPGSMIKLWDPDTQYAFSYMCSKQCVNKSYTKCECASAVFMWCQNNQKNSPLGKFTLHCVIGGGLRCDLKCDGLLWFIIKLLEGNQLIEITPT